ncbi:ribonuclease III [Pontibacter sp. G13]|uniref:ribonuclease III n=1 Tax=Pontibacter sp. G13 TaxID=3074898 RepID=UPI00288A6918|nr:ribonuclease III [Pontibacter sp. G13]WNJ21058.1 ribonuclease III [Pontibacter sp. G13]
MLTPRQAYNISLSKDRAFVADIKGISGYIPKEVFLYRLALTHSSSIKPTDKKSNRRKAVAKGCNERLEFLGDSILDAVIAEYLFKIYPYKDEGFLTEMRSKIVNRKSLNTICKKLGIDNLIFHKQTGSINESMYGDALEAFIGALYLDLGYQRTKLFIHNRIIQPHIHLHSVENQVISYKNKLIEYVQKTKMGLLIFEVIEEIGEGRNKVFRIQAKVGADVLGVGEGKNKKSAEQRASEDALLKLNALVPAPTPS